MSTGVKDISILKRRGKIRMIEDIEKLRAKLNVKGIGHTLDVIVFENRKIEVNKSRADESVAAKIASQIQARLRIWLGHARCRVDVDHVDATSGNGGSASGNDEALLVDVVNGISGVNKRVAAGAIRQTRHVNGGVR